MSHEPYGAATSLHYVQRLNKAWTNDQAAEGYALQGMHICTRTAVHVIR